ncbi:15-hydroxyprostaglandin dehydrogenase [NAD(+)]-like [Elysia marginata]|uniref:15-hydroxyprostaglandin dehydrogenase [NAD(+)] n=1 Tax=Elysia marginata TaxID=1093978 RepID=A0AAV4H8T0_9GAST|nr:15-hydroxyprostaglandin dehydrogenase [NAD(+)]-like [Elysia marginata]
MPKYEIENKVFFITGGAQGFGKEIAKGVLSKGAKVFFVDILREKGNETLRELAHQFSSSHVAFTAADIVNTEAFEYAFTEAIRVFGQVDVLLNNAAIADETNMSRMIETNFTAVIHGSQVASNYMRKDKGGKGGRIIAMSSIAGLGYYYQLPVYNAAKHGIRVYSKASSQNPSNKDRGLEFACFHPDASNIGIFPTIDNGQRGIRDAAEILESYRDNFVPIEDVVEAFIELASLEHMNGADLFVGKNKRTYMEVEGREVGDKYPAES